MNTRSHDRPNIILITTDTQRWDTLGCMGSGFARSPNLDRMAAEGVMFTQAHTSSPVCMPTRCSLLTGLHTPVHGCIENGIDRREDVPILTDALEKAGYTNIMVGKTHFGPVPASFHVTNITKGEKNSDNDDEYARHIRNHGYSRSSSHPNPIPPELFMDAYLADRTIESIERVRSADKGPFFAFCSFPSPHGPIDPPGEWATMYEGAELPPLNYREGEISEHPAHLRRLVGTYTPDEAASLGMPEPERTARNGGKSDGNTDPPALREAAGNTIQKTTETEVDRYRRLYYGLTAYCDAQVGRILDYLDSSGLREDTLVIFTSDHGQQYFDHGFNDKHNYYDETWRIPFLMRMPGTIPQDETRDFAGWTDITATILAAAGAEDPFSQGFDLFGPLSQGQESPRRCAVGSLYKSAAVATMRWKLEYYLEEQTGRLFDRLNDPAEQHDLYGADEHREVRDTLVAALLGWRADLTDVHFLHDHTHRGGPVARRIAARTKAMRGNDSEKRLNQAVADLE